jgi:phenylacetate-CoA ligase
MSSAVPADAPRTATAAAPGWLDRAYATAFRSTLWPLMNRATGRTVHQVIPFLERSQWWSRDELHAYQLAKLQRLIRHVYDAVPFYAREMRSRDLHPDDFQSLDTLDRMPVITKAQLKAAPEDFLARGASLDRLVAGTTSGSTGQPTKFYRSRAQDSWHWALKYRMWGMAGYRLGLPYANLYNMKRAGLRKRVQDFVLRNHDFYVFGTELQQELLRRVLDRLRRPNIHFLAGCTSTLRILADLHAAEGDAAPLGLRAVLSTGSLLTPAERRHIESALGAPLWDHYGLGGEGAHVAAECEMKRGYHINVENMIIAPAEPECVDTDEPARIHVTVLDDFDWPLIRYDSGDAAVFASRTCPCGRGLPLLERIDGRVSETLTLPSGNRVNVHYFSVLFGRQPEVNQYQVEQRSPHDLVVRIVWKSTPPADGKSQLAAALQKTGGADLRVTFEDVDHIPLGRSGKHRYVIALPASRTPVNSVD